MSGEANSPFMLGSKVTQFAAGAAGINLDGPSTGGLIQFLIQNTNAATVAVAYATVAATAQTNAAIPAAGSQSAANVIIIPANTTKVVTAPPGQYWSSSSALVFITPGNGL
jgi:hypothetical protein